MNIGIDKISFYSPNQYIEMTDLALWRDVDPNKYTIGLGQNQMAIPLPSQDTVTLAANAAEHILNFDDKESIDLVLFATETGLDFSKALALNVRQLLDLPHQVRCLEIKEACYAGTGALQLAKAHVALYPNKKVLILASDISRYGLNTAGEPTQGAGAVAMLISQNPKILKLDTISSYYSDDIQDFWRPYYSEVALVDGKFSNEQYQRFFDLTYKDYMHQSQRNLSDFAAFCFHVPYTKIGLKALRTVANEETHSTLFENYELATQYNRRVGNIYTGSLYLSLISLLDSKKIHPGERIGLYSYGSGSVGEFFSGTLVEGYQEALFDGHQAMLDNRTRIDLNTYEEYFNYQYPQDGSTQIINHQQDTGTYILESVENHTRFYTKK